MRYIIFDLCIDVEHYLKKEIVRRVTEQSDPYNIVSDYFKINGRAKERIETQDKSSSYSHNLIEKYKDKFPIWAFAEVASFGTITSFCDFYKEKCNDSIVESKVLNNVRDLRNAVAHNCCLLVNVTKTKQVSNIGTISIFASNCGLGLESRRKNLSNKFIMDLTCLLYVHKMLINDDSKFIKLKSFLDKKAVQNKEYFKKNQPICRVYKFIKKLVEGILTYNK